MLARVFQLGLDEDDLGQVGRRDVPFLAVDHVFVTMTAGRGGDGVHVRPGAFLGDGVALVEISGDEGEHVAVHLVLGRHLGQPSGRGRHDPTEGVGDAAGLLLDQRLLEHRVALASQLDRLVDGKEAELPGVGEVTCRHVGWDFALVHLGVHLPGDQLGFDEPGGPGLDLPVLVGHCSGHVAPLLPGFPEQRFSLRGRASRRASQVGPVSLDR